AAHLASRYDAPVETIEEDLGRFFSKLEQESLVVRMTLNNGRSPTLEPPLGQRAVYQAPDLHTHTDLQELFLIDPIHDVSAAGWPNVEPKLDHAVSALDLSQEEFYVSGPQVIFERLGDETVIMNLETGAYYSISGTAEDVFSLAEQTPTFEELRLALSSKYAVDTAELGPALQAYLTELIDAGLIIRRRPESTGNPRTLAFTRPRAGLPFAPMRLASFQESAATAAGTSAGPAGIVQFRMRPNDLLVASADGEMVLADRQSGDYWRLNQPAIDVFSLLARQPLRVEQLVAAILRKYDVPDRQLTGAVMILLRNLTAVNLVVIEPAEPADHLAAPEVPALSGRVPFPGFRCDVYKDLRELMSPFNVRQHPAAPDRASRMTFFLDALSDYFSEAWKPGTERSLTLAGYGVRFQCASPIFTDDLTKALAHLAPVPSSTPADLTIHIWDASTLPTDPYLATILEKLFSNWSESCGPRGELIGIHGEQVAAVYHPGPDILSVVDRMSGRAYFLKRDLTPLPYWEIGSPFRYIFHTWFAARGLQFVHGGAVGTSAGGVLLTAKGGSGKSTTTMLCAEAGMQFAGDDYCLADPRTGYLHSLYNSSKLKGPEDLKRLPDLTGLSRNLDSFENGGFGKAIYFLSDIWGDRL
ncbi:MAG: PqqD family peptide modification chaperone, partial [Bryobacteraceae bacterium]